MRTSLNVELRRDFSAINGKSAEQILHAQRRQAFPKKRSSRRLFCTQVASGGSAWHRVLALVRCSVLQWIGTLGTKLCLNIQSFPDEKVIVMELDELWYYLKKRSKKFRLLKLMIVIANEALIGNMVIVLLPYSQNSLTDSEHGKLL